MTCLKFAKGNRLAAGLSNGVVHYIEQSLSTMMKTVPRPEDLSVTPLTHSIKLLPVQDPGLYIKCIGCTTNLAFSPNLKDQEEGVWLAIATERSGIWIWNQRSRQALRAVRTGGMSEGCLHWISLEGIATTRPNPAETRIYQDRYLGQSEMAK